MLTILIFASLAARDRQKDSFGRSDLKNGFVKPFFKSLSPNKRIARQRKPSSKGS